MVNGGVEVAPLDDDIREQLGLCRSPFDLTTEANLVEVSLSCRDRDQIVVSSQRRSNSAERPSSSDSPQGPMPQDRVRTGHDHFGDTRLSCSDAHPLTAPALSPWTRYFCT